MAKSSTESSAPAKPAPAPTLQQQAAIDTKHVSVVLSAGAGCGKTSVLTQRFLSHLEPGPDAVDLSRLVAITFTERAASEMRKRIRSQCLNKLLTCPADQADHWLNIARTIDSARISTIHGFCSSLLRTHAVEANLDPKFGLLDEMLGASFLGNAVESGLHKLLASDNADAAELVFEFGLGRAQGLLTSLVHQRYRIDSLKWEGKTARELATEWDQHWHTKVVPEMLRELAESFPARKTLELLKTHKTDHKVMQQRREALLDQLPRVAAAEQPAELLHALRENARVQGGGTKKDWDSEEIYNEVKDALTDLRDQIDKVGKQLEFDSEDLLRGAEISLCALRATQAVGAHYDDTKRESAVVDFDDLLLQARNLLRDHAHVRNRVSAGISLLMVDEFQDTDPIQDEIVQMICGPAALTGKLFVVGDAKQSIYRFRRAEPRVFHLLRERVAPAGRLPLNQNFRSQPEILWFVNAVFDGALGNNYEALVPGLEQKVKPPCVEFLFASAGPDEAADADADGNVSTLSPARRRREADWIARRLKQLLTDGVARIPQEGEPELRKAKPGDIVILFRAMSDVRYYEEGLRQHGLDCYVVGGRAFFAQQEIFDVVNLCQYLDNVDDQISLVGVRRSPFFSLSDDALVALGKSQSLTQALNSPPPTWLSEEQQALVRFAGEVLRELRDQKDRLPIAQLLNLAIEKTGYDASLLAEFLGSRKLANLRKLIDMARQFDQSGLFTLSDFVARLRDAVADETHEPLAATHPESSNIIRLMSIHQSKGLEFPIVVVADMDRPSRNQSSGANFDPDFGPVLALPDKFGEKRDYPAVRMLRQSERRQDEEESLRVFYVAATRAADLLILSANLARAGQPSNSWLKLVAERFDLLTGQPRQAPTATGLSIIARYSKELPKIGVHQAPPDVESHTAAGDGSPPLSKLREAVTQATPEPLPETCRKLSPDLRSQRRFSVSTLEQLDQELRQPPTSAAKDVRPVRPVVVDGESLSGKQPLGRLPDSEQLGTLVHQVLERLNFGEPGDIPVLIERCLSSTGTSVDDLVRQTAAACVQNLLNSSLAVELASAATCHRELDFLLKSPLAGQPPFVITGTMDCLYESASGEWIVLDYKTGLRDRSATPAELLYDYEIQLGLYALAFQQFLGRPPDRLELVFIRNGVDRVPFEPTPARLADVTNRVSAIFRAHG